MNDDLADFPELPGYKVTRAIGQGGMGRVWQGIQLSTGREVAIKCPTSERFLEKFQREMVFGSNVQHRHVVPVYHGNTDVNESPMFFAMRLILAKNGEPMTARELVSTEGPETKKNRKDFFRTRATQVRNLSEALGAIHGSRIIHGDIKLDNLLVDCDDEWHITDFGLADYSDQEFFGEGTSLYVSPDQAAGQTTMISDIYSLGVTMALALGSYDKEKLLEKLESLASDEPCQPLPDDFRVSSFCPEAPAYLKWIVEKATARNPVARFQTADELVDHLNGYLGNKPSPDDRWWWIKQCWIKINEYRSYIAAALALLLITLLVAYIFRSDLNRRTELVEQALVPLRDGDSVKARPLLDKALDGYEDNAPLEWQIYSARSRLGSTNKSEMLKTLSRLYKEHSSRDKGYAELSLLYADFVSCDEVQRDTIDWRSILDQLPREELPVADRYYLDALQAEDLEECRRLLKLALSFRPFHDRASELYAIVSLILGQVGETDQFCEGQLKNKKANATFLCSGNVAAMLAEQSTTDQIVAETFPTNVNQKFVKAFRSVLPQPTGLQKNQQSHWAQNVIALQKQIEITNNAESLIRSCSDMHPNVAVPLHIIERRANDWNQLAQKLTRISKNEFTNDSLEELKPFAKNDPDGFSMILMSMIVSNEVYDAINKGDYEKKGKEIYSRFLEYQESANEKPSIVPSSAFRYFNLFMQTLTEFGAMNEVGLDDPQILNNLRKNTELLVDLSANIPRQMRTETLSALLGGCMASADLALQRNLQQVHTRLTVLSLKIADDWVAQYPQDPFAFLFRAYFFEHLGQNESAINDVECAVRLDDSLKQAKELQKKLLSKKQELNVEEPSD